MKIGVFTNNYLPNIYGVTTSIESFRFELEKRGHQVFIFAPFFKGYQDINSNVFRYPSLDLQYKIRFPLPIPYSRKISKIIQKIDLDIIHSQHPNLLGNAAYYWSKKKKIPLVFTWHTLYDHYINFVPIIPAKLASKWIIKKAVNYANKTDQIIVPTNSVKKIIQKWGVFSKKTIEILPTGINENNFKNFNKEKIRNKYGFKKNDVVLLLVSRLTEEKNVEFIFQSLQPLLETNNNIKFLVVGEGYLKKYLENKYAKFNKNQIIFSGLINKKEIKNYYAAGDIFVYASESETQGLIIIEALYMQLPVVALNASGVTDVLSNSQAGILTKKNKDEFRQAVQYFINNKKERILKGQKGKELVLEKYTASITSEKLENIYQKNIQKYYHSIK